ncbi:MAG: hypothetical protein GKS00_11375 [Alphaproteobacteria bacterium]|nr:hypothetical protein [Alphaproteobacteria bacterium]NKC02282.1 hypothetical protein [Pseudomonadales bacterium]
MNHSLIPIFGNKRVKALLATLVCCSAYFTYDGAVIAITAGTADWMGHAGALVFSLSSSTAIYLLWTAAPVAVSKLEVPLERVLGLCITFFSAFLIACLSSWLNVASIAGTAAIVFHMNVLLVEFEAVLEQRFTAIVSTKSLLPDLKQAQTLYLARRESEYRRGAYTGIPGPGSVEQLLQSLSDQFGTLEGSFAIELVRREGIAKQAREQLDVMRKVANAPGEPNVRMDNLAREADKLRALLSELDPRGLIKSLQRTLHAMPREVDLQSTSSRSSRGANAQRAALERIHGELIKTVGQFGAELAMLSKLPVPAVPAITRLNAIEAVIRYPLQHAPFWAGGIALDATPTVLLLYAMILMYVRGRAGLFDDASNDVTMKEAQVVLHALETIREARISREAMDRQHDELTGAPLLKDESNAKSD